LVELRGMVPWEGFQRDGLWDGLRGRGLFVRSQCFEFFILPQIQCFEFFILVGQLFSSVFRHVVRTASRLAVRRPPLGETSWALRALLWRGMCGVSEECGLFVEQLFSPVFKHVVGDASLDRASGPGRLWEAQAGTVQWARVSRPSNMPSCKWEARARTCSSLRGEWGPFLHGMLCGNSVLGKRFRERS